MIKALPLLLLAGSLQAQGLGGLLKKAAPAKTESAAGTISAGDALLKGAELITYVTVATDQGMKAMDSMMEMFPAEKVEKLKKLSAQYAELKGKRKDGNIDAEQLKVASAISEETSKLDGDWKSYKKEKAQTSAKVYGRLGLMMLADTQAVRVAPDTLKGLQGSLDAIKSNPTQLGNVGKLTAQVALLGAASQQLPGQIQSATTVRKIAKNIADAEKVKLAQELKPEQVKDAQSLSSSAKEID